jgi:hypothetical protein
MGFCDDLERDKEHARKIDQPATAIQATLAQAKLMGLLIDRKESGKPGEFAHMSVDELRKQLKEDLDALEQIRARKSIVQTLCGSVGGGRAVAHGGRGVT